MPDISRLYVHADGDVIEADEINADFDQLIAAVNDRVENDSTLWADLYAEALHDGTDTYPVDAAGGSGNIPVCDSTTIQVGLNADLLDGSHLSDILDAGFDSGTAMLFYQELAPGGWSVEPAPSIARHFGWKTAKTGGTTETNTTWSGSLEALANVTVDSHVLTLAELAQHSHLMGNGLNAFGSVSSVAVQSGAGQSVLTASVLVPSVNDTGDVGSDTGHNHTASFDTNGVEWQPPVAWTIVCTKD